jgi:hypothetical protein
LKVAADQVAADAMAARELAAVADRAEADAMADVAHVQKVAVVDHAPKAVVKVDAKADVDVAISAELPVLKWKRDRVQRQLRWKRVDQVRLLLAIRMRRCRFVRQKVHVPSAASEMLKRKTETANTWRMAAVIKTRIAKAASRKKVAVVRFRLARRSLSARRSPGSSSRSSAAENSNSHLTARDEVASSLSA